MSPAAYPATLVALIEAGRLTEANAHAAFVRAAQAQQPVLQLLMREGVVTSREILEANCAVSHIEFVDALVVEVDPAAAAAIPANVAHDHVVLPVCFRNGTLVVAVQANAYDNLNLKDELERRTGGVPVQFAVAVKVDLIQRIAAQYPVSNDYDNVDTDVADDDGSDSWDDENTEVAETVKRLLSQAIDRGAQDIHLDPGSPECVSKLRVDGDIAVVSRYPKSKMPPIVQFIKNRAGLDMSERRKSQNGRMRYRHRGKSYDMRIATLPTVHTHDGLTLEKVTMRILDDSYLKVPVDKIGFSASNLKLFLDALEKPNGLVLLAGRTGSGKTTTIHSGLNHLKADGTKQIISAEDPVEFVIDGIVQVQISGDDNGMDYEAIGEELMRHNPDVIFLGEIRSKKTAMAAATVSISGHLVVSTVHTSNATEAIDRLRDLGAPAYAVSNALNAVVAQRLARKVCQECKVPYTLTEEEIAQMPRFPWNPEDPLPTVARANPAGCVRCDHKGYKGRVPLHEVLTVTPTISDAISRAAPRAEMDEIARSEGMTTLIEDGWKRVLEGITTIPAVFVACADAI